MKKSTKDQLETEEKEYPPESPPIGDDGDIYLFNPWDRLFEAERKPQTHKFEF